MAKHRLADDHGGFTSQWERCATSEVARNHISTPENPQMEPPEKCIFSFHLRVHELKRKSPMIDHTTRFRPSSSLVSLVAFDLSTAFSPRHKPPEKTCLWHTPRLPQKVQPWVETHQIPGSIGLCSPQSGNDFCLRFGFERGSLKPSQRNTDKSKPNQKNEDVHQWYLLQITLFKKKTEKNIADFQRSPQPYAKVMLRVRNEFTLLPIFPDFNQSKQLLPWQFSFQNPSPRQSRNPQSIYHEGSINPPQILLHQHLHSLCQALIVHLIWCLLHQPKASVAIFAGRVRFPFHLPTFAYMGGRLVWFVFFFKYVVLPIRFNPSHNIITKISMLKWSNDTVILLNFFVGCKENQDFPVSPTLSYPPFQWPPHWASHCKNPETPVAKMGLVCETTVDLNTANSTRRYMRNQTWLSNCLSHVSRTNDANIHMNIVDVVL